MDYTPRALDRTIERLLSFAGGLLVEGPRACGKTSTGMHHARSVVRLDLNDEALALAELDPATLLEGERPRLIDEWQLAPKLWNHVRRAVDESSRAGAFILTGSAVPPDDITRHSGAGRILRLRMRTMTLFESGQSNGSVSLAGLLSGESTQRASSDIPLAQLVDRLVIGGWPGLQHLEPVDAQIYLRSYLDDVARTDISALAGDGARRDPSRVRRLMSAYARHVSTPASTATIIADTAQPGSSELRPETVSQYLENLERLMIVEEQPSWGPHLRSRDIVRKGAVRHFVDPSLAVAGLNASSDRLLREPNTLGLLFESLVIRDLRVYTELLDGEVRHYRDSSGTESDAILQLRDGRWAAIEVKLSSARVDEAAASLQKLTGKIDTKRTGDPIARIVITAGEYAYTRPDGIHVVPITCLGP